MTICSKNIYMEECDKKNYLVFDTELRAYILQVSTYFTRKEPRLSLSK